MIKPIPRCPNAFADESGNIYSVDPYHYRSSLRQLKPFTNGKYLMVSVRRDGKSKRQFIHQMMLETFVSPRPEGMYACHGERGRLCNELNNLYWATGTRNHKEDKLRDNTHLTCETHNMAKLNWWQVRVIRRSHFKLTENGLGGRELAKIFNVSPPTICRIASNKNWFNQPKVNV